MVNGFRSRRSRKRVRNLTSINTGTRFDKPIPHTPGCTESETTCEKVKRTARMTPREEQATAPLFGTSGLGGLIGKGNVMFALVVE
jgi:hypothetical protein